MYYVFETFANFWRVSVSVSENLVSNKKSRFRKIWPRRKSLGFGKFGLGKISRYRFRSKFWYRHSVHTMILHETRRGEGGWGQGGLAVNLLKEGKQVRRRGSSHSPPTSPLTGRGSWQSRGTRLSCTMCVQVWRGGGSPELSNTICPLAKVSCDS